MTFRQDLLAWLGASITLGLFDVWLAGACALGMGVAVIQRQQQRRKMRESK